MDFDGFRELDLKTISESSFAYDMLRGKGTLKVSRI
jgi:hypothetical protein